MLGLFTPDPIIDGRAAGDGERMLIKYSLCGRVASLLGFYLGISFRFKFWLRIVVLVLLVK